MDLLPTAVSSLKFALGIPIYMAVTSRSWILAIFLGLAAIYLDFADGGLTRWLLNHGIIRKVWEYGPIADGLTDLWQGVFYVALWREGLFPWWFLLIAGALAVLGFILSLGKYEDEGLFGRGIILANSVFFTTYGFIRMGQQIDGVGNWAIPIVLLIGLILVHATRKGWIEKNINGELESTT